MTSTYPDAETRKQKALQRLGTQNPICKGCGEDDWRCMEAHHIAGKAHHDDTALLCSNCHRKVTDDQKDHPTDADGEKTKLATIGHFLLGLADLFRLIAERLVEFGRSLLDFANEPQFSAPT